MPTREVDETLLRAIDATDAARRVGWARAFSAEESKDEVSRALNMAESDRGIWQRAASYLYGVLSAYADMRDDGAALRERLTRWRQDIDLLLDEPSRERGRDETLADPAINDSRIERRRVKAETRAAFVVPTSEKNRIYEKGWDSAERALAKRFGFLDESGRSDTAAMKVYLADRSA